MIEQGCFTNGQIADDNGCRIGAVKAIKRNLRVFGSTKAPGRRGGRPSSITPEIRDALLAHLDKNPELYFEEMVAYIWDEFRVHVTRFSVSRALRSAKWSKKKFRRKAVEQNPDLVDYYLHTISPFHSYQFVFVDESGSDNRDGFRRTGWSPRGVTPVQVTKFHRGKRYQILPAYCQDGILLSRIFQGPTDGPMFEDFIEQLLHYCGRFPEPKSILVMDNISFHRSEWIKQMCEAAGVKVIYLPPYSPRLNPIEEFFAELKAFIKKYWKVYEENPEQGFAVFLQWCVDVVGGKEESARGHFRHAGLTIEEPVPRGAQIAVC
jgi:transposase